MHLVRTHIWLYIADAKQVKRLKNATVPYSRLHCSFTDLMLRVYLIIVLSSHSQRLTKHIAYRLYGVKHTIKNIGKLHQLNT
jgi:hypothetical protein